MKIGILILFLTALVLRGGAQETPAYHIRGKITDTAHRPLPGAGVSLRSAADSAWVAGAAADSAGNIRMAGITAGTYTLVIQYLGYLPDTRSLTVNGDLDLGTIALRINSQVLEGVEVEARAPLITRKLDRTIVHIDRSIHSTGENAYRLMNVVPEVRSDGLGNINFRGQQGVVVYINDKPIKLEGQLLMNYLQGIPSESIQRIEVISVPGAQFEAEGTAAIVNIVTKKEYRYGLSGTLTASYDQHRYSGTGAGLLLNYRKGKANFFTRYNYSRINFFNDLNQYQQYLEKSPVLIFDQDENYRESYHDHVAELGFAYDMDPNHEFGAKLRLNHVKWDMRYASITRAESNGRLDSILTTGNTENEYLNDQSFQVFFDKNLDTAGSKLRFDFEYLKYRNPSEAFYFSDFFLPDHARFRPRDSSFIENPIRIWIKTAGIDLNKKLRSHWSLFAGAKWSAIDTDNENVYFTGRRPFIVTDSSRSNRFLYNENIYALYASISKEWQKFTFNLGLRLENTVYNGHSLTLDETFERERLDLFPSIFVQYAFSDKHLLGGGFNRRIMRPAYEKLNPFQDYQNPYSYVMGNPDLGPALASSIELNYRYRNNYSLSLGYKKTEDLIQSILYRENELTVVSTYRNLNAEKYYFASLSIPVEVNNWWSIYTNVNFYNQQIDRSEGSSPKRYRQSTLFSYARSTFNLPRDLSLEVSGYYRTRSLFQIYESKPYGAVNLSARKQFLEERLTLGLSFYDIFRTQKSRINYTFEGVVRNTSSVYMSQLARLSLSYSFRQGKRNPTRDDRESIIEEERSRID